MNGYGAYYPSDACGDSEKIGRIGKAIGNSLSLRDIFTFTKKGKQKLYQKTEKRFGEAGRSEDLEYLNKIHQNITNMAKDPGYADKFAEAIGQGISKEVEDRSINEKILEDNRISLKEKVDGLLDVVDVKRKRKNLIQHDYIVIPKVDSLYEEVAKRATEKIAKDIRNISGGNQLDAELWVYDEMEKIIKEEEDTEKRNKITGIRNWYAQNQELLSEHLEKKRSRQKKTAGFLTLAVAGVGAGLGLYLMNAGNVFSTSNDEEDYLKGKNISPNLMEKIMDIDDNDSIESGEIALIDYVSDLNDLGVSTTLQEKVIDGFAPGGISASEYHQLQFMASLPKEEQIEHIDDGSFVNPNWDRDVMGENWFEKFVSKTDYNKPNNTYAVVMTMAGHEDEDIREMFDSLEDMNIPKENVYDLSSDRNNSFDFEAAINNISQKSTSNDNVIIIMHGEGNDGNFGFKNLDKIVSYDWVDEKLNNIKSNKTVVIVDSCKSGSSIDYLKDSNRILLTSGKEDEKTSFSVGHEFLKSFLNPSADSDRNGYVSIEEAAINAKKLETSDSTTPQLSIPENNETGYISDVSVED